MAKRNIILNEETYQALKRVAKKEHIPVADVIRRAIALHLAERGEVVNTEVSWGGPRKQTNQEE